MATKLGLLRDRTINRILGFDVRRTALALKEWTDQDAEWKNSVSASFVDLLGRQAETANWQAGMAEWRAESLEQSSFVRRRFEAHLQAVRDHRDNVSGMKRRLTDLRNTDAYEHAHDDARPLVSVRIASYEKTEELVDIAIASVLRQTYDNFEIVIVNDGPNVRTRRAVDAIGDPRIRYSELPERGRYPSDPHSRWMVAGSPAMNRAAELSRGAWIAPLDDDDEFTDDHIEKLVALAIGKRVELAYGALTQKHLKDGTEKRIWSSPPAISEFSFQGAIYLKMLDFFKYDESSWVVEEPGDWNLIRRMSAAGVRMACTEDVVATMNMVPYTLKDSE